VRDWYFDWLLISTALVVVGLFMEGPEVVHAATSIFRNRQDPTPRWIAFLALLGWILVVLGVAGEGIAEGYVSWAEGTLQTYNDILLSDATKEAAFALERAANANKRAAEIEQRMADRHITLEQRKKMLAILVSHRSARVAVAFITPSLPDAQEYSIEIGGVFRDAGWTVVPSPWLTTMGNPVHGFAVVIREKESSPKRKSLERVTREALAVLDGRFSVTYGGQDPETGINLDLEILVGNK
jgi:hypothetical protein